MGPAGTCFLEPHFFVPGASVLAVLQCNNHHLIAVQLPSLGTPTYHLCLHYLLVGTPCEYHFPVRCFLFAREKSLYNLLVACWRGIRTSCVDYIRVLFLCPHKVYVHQAQAGFSLVPDMPPGSITRDGLLLSLFLSLDQRAQTGSCAP